MCGLRIRHLKESIGVGDAVGNKDPILDTALSRKRDCGAETRRQPTGISVVNFWCNRVIGDQFLPP